MKNRITILIFLLFYLISCEKKRETKIKNTQETKVWYNQDLNNKSLEELKLIRNEIYARKGYVFKNQKLQDYFSAKEWYKPNTNAKITLTEIEKKNVELIKNIEYSKKNEISDKKYVDTIYIDYLKHKKLLEILKIIPESSMTSWEWKKHERKETVDFIKKNNFLIDTTEMFYNITEIKPNRLNFQVVDGYWTLAIYRFSEYDLVITNDVVGDGNDTQTYIYKNGKIVPTKMINLFESYLNKLLVNSSKPCTEFLKENYHTFDYDFSNKDIVKISTWLLKDNANDCIKGNTIKLKMDTQNNSFIVKSIYWNK